MITVAAGFPDYSESDYPEPLVPVFVDVELPTYDVDVAQLEAALRRRTRAVMFAHTLGNPFDLDRRHRLSRNEHHLWLIEDNCDALGSTYRGQMSGTFGDLATFSFYPAHHITMGEGGAVLTNSRNCACWSNRSAIGAATAGARPAKTTPAASVSNGNSASSALRLRSQVHLFAHRL